MGKKCTHAAHNLMDVTRRNDTRVDQRIDSLNHQLGAVESNHRDARRSERQSKGFVPARHALYNRS